MVELISKILRAIRSLKAIFYVYLFRPKNNFLIWPFYYHSLNGLDRKHTKTNNLLQLSFHNFLKYEGTFLITYIVIEFIFSNENAHLNG